jgi:GNAT superfamily N-acetyltransferase
LKIAVLTDELESLYWSLVNQDYCDFYFFIYDFLFQKEKTKITLALDQGKIAGLMLVYDDCIVQLRGNPESAGLLLGALSLGNFELQAPVEWEQKVLETFPSCLLKSCMTLMTVERGKETLAITVQPERLHVQDAYDIAQLMRESYPEMWSGVTGEGVRNMFSSESTVWFGIKREGKLEAFGSANLTRNVGHVMWLATSKQERNQGYGTSIVSALTKECLRRADKALIYVLDDNESAKSVYLKVGFKPYKRYLFIKTSQH